jgi:hypothetical protein
MRDPQLGHLSLAAASGVVNSVVRSSAGGVVKSRCSAISIVELESTATLQVFLRALADL